MNKENSIIRIIIYIMLFLLFLGLSVLGFYFYNKGYGKDGKIKKEVTPIIEKFNILKDVKNNNAIKAKFNKDKIKITYIIGKDKNEYFVSYTEVADLKILELQYEASDNINGEYIGKLLLEAVMLYKNYSEGELFNKIQYIDLYKLNTKQGANLSRRGNTMSLMININTDFIENIKDLTLTEVVINYITTNDITNLNEEIIKNNKYTYHKNDLMLDVRANETNYEIYCSNTQENYNDIFESIMSVVTILNPQIYDEIIISNFDYKNSIAGKKFKIEVNPQIDKTIITTDDKYLIKITITK